MITSYYFELFEFLQVKFIAINCRAVNGDCRSTYTNVIFPTITGNFAYGFIQINYLRPFSHSYLVSSM